MDVNNPLCGENGVGAWGNFWPSKSAVDKEMTELLDRNLKHFANIIKSQLNKDIIDMSKAGAAGGLGAGVAVFLNAELKQGDRCCS